MIRKNIKGDNGSLTVSTLYKDTPSKQNMTMVIKESIPLFELIIY